MRLVETHLAEAGIAIDEASVAVLGLTYRAGIPETSNSPAGPIIEGLQASGANVVGVDPALSAATVFGVHRISLDGLVRFDPDAAVILCGHEAFKTYDWGAHDDLVLIDTRDVLGEVPQLTYTVGSGRS